MGYCDGGNTGLECTGWAPPGRATKCCVELQGPRGCPDWPSLLVVPAAPYWLPTGPDDVSRKLASGKAVECLRFSAPELLTPQGYRGTLCRKGTGVLKGPVENLGQKLPKFPSQAIQASPAPFLSRGPSTLHHAPPWSMLTIPLAHTHSYYSQFRAENTEDQGVHEAFPKFQSQVWQS